MVSLEEEDGVKLSFSNAYFMEEVPPCAKGASYIWILRLMTRIEVSGWIS